MNAFQRELGNLQHRQQLLYILLFSFATVIVWIGVSLLTSQRRTGIPAATLLLATPLNPTINTPILDEIKTKRVYTTEELSLFPIYKVVVNRDGGPDQLVDISLPTPIETSPLGNGVATPAATLSVPGQTPDVTPPPAPGSGTDQSAPAELPPGAASTSEQPEATPESSPPAEVPGT